MNAKGFPKGIVDNYRNTYQNLIQITVEEDIFRKLTRKVNIYCHSNPLNSLTAHYSLSYKATFNSLRILKQVRDSECIFAVIDRLQDRDTDNCHR